MKYSLSLKLEDVKEEGENVEDDRSTVDFEQKLHSDSVFII